MLRQLQIFTAPQVLSHLRLLGLLVNFHELVVKDGLKRIVNNYREE